MSKALREIGLRKAVRYGVQTLAAAPLSALLFPQARAAYLRLLGARIGADSIIHDIRCFNLYRTGFAGLRIGARCFLGEGCLLDLADRIELADDVTLAERVTILTHRNVGYADHPLQRHFPPMQAPVLIERGAFIGASVTVLAGVRIGAASFVAAGAVVTEDVPPGHLVGGVPARVLRRLD